MLAEATGRRDPVARAAPLGEYTAREVDQGTSLPPRPVKLCRVVDFRFSFWGLAKGAAIIRIGGMSSL